MELFNFIAGLCSVIGLVLAGIAAYQSYKQRQETHEEKKRLNQKIKVTLLLTDGNKQLESPLPVELRRGELSRAELLGRLGMIPMKEKGKRFTLKYTNTKAFLGELGRVQQSSGQSILVIPCSKEEIEQFDLPT